MGVMAVECKAASSTLSQRLFHFYDALRELALKVEVPTLYCRCQIWYHSLLSPIIKEVATPWHLKVRSGGGLAAWGLPGIRKSLRRLSLLACHNTCRHQHIEAWTFNTIPSVTIGVCMHEHCDVIHSKVRKDHNGLFLNVSYSVSVIPSWKLITDVQVHKTWSIFKVL